MILQLIVDEANQDEKEDDENIDPAEFNLNLDEHSTNIEPFDNRSIRLILEEKLKSCDEHIKELKALGYVTDDELKAMGYTRD